MLGRKLPPIPMPGIKSAYFPSGPEDMSGTSLGGHGHSKVSGPLAQRGDSPDASHHTQGNEFTSGAANVHASMSRAAATLPSVGVYEVRFPSYRCDSLREAY